MDGWSEDLGLRTDLRNQALNTLIYTTLHIISFYLKQSLARREKTYPRGKLTNVLTNEKLIKVKANPRES